MTVYPSHIIFFIAALMLLGGCKDMPQVDVKDDSEVYAGGENLTTFVRGENTFGTQAMGLTREQSRLFVAGNSLFRSNWVQAPASVTSLDGLGPLFNATSCGGCHFKDGRAAPPGEFSVPKTGLLFHISTDETSIYGTPIPHSIYGLQLQDRSIPSVAEEAKIDITYSTVSGVYADGTPYTLQKPLYRLENTNYGEIVGDLKLSPRIATHLSGLGLLESISEKDILLNEDVDDADGDGISGKANYVYDIEKDQYVLGRFGWKASQPSVNQQNAAAFNNDMGLTSSLFPKDQRTPTQIEAYPDMAEGGMPEVSDEQLFRIKLYVQALSVPASRDTDTPTYDSGKKTFIKIGCASCHIPSFTTSRGNDLEVLDNQKIAPYTDLLLHDMGDGLADNRRDHRASGREWRTAPLWGIGLIPAVNKHTRYLHDGRARNLKEAILWHGGEAEKSKNKFKKLTKKEREELIFFLKSI